MKPAPFRYHAPATVDEAVELLASLADDDVRVLAGGQSIMPMLSLRLAQPDHVVDLNRVDELAHLGTDNGEFVIGAMVRQRVAERSGDVAARVPLLSAALPYVGHVQIRNRGTVGGSLAHADPAAELPAIVLATDATLVARSARGERRIAAGDFFQGYLETALQPGEILTQVRFPALPEGAGTAFAEVSRRHGDFALVGVAAMVRLDGGAIANARLSFLGVDATPVRATTAEDVLRGAQPGAEAFDAAAERVRADLNPRSDLHASGAYRAHVGSVLARNVLHTAADQARS